MNHQRRVPAPLFLGGHAVECPWSHVRVTPMLPVDGDKQNTRWVVFDAGAQYAVGRFDGRTFTPEHEGKYRVHHGAYFASQTFTNAPDGRCIQMAWARLNLSGMPFNQAFTFPHQLTLRKTPDGIRMFAQPVREIAKLRTKSHTGTAGTLTPDAPRKIAVSGELLEVRAEFVLGQAKVVGLDIGGNRVTHDVAADGKVTIHVLLDRPMIEICLNNGASYTTEGRDKRGAVEFVSAFAVGGPAMLKSFDVHELKSIWKPAPAASPAEVPLAGQPLPEDNVRKVIVSYPANQKFVIPQKHEYHQTLTMTRGSSVHT